MSFVKITRALDKSNINKQERREMIHNMKQAALGRFYKMLVLLVLIPIVYVGCSDDQSMNSPSDDETSMAIGDQLLGMNDIFNQTDKELILEVKKATTRFNSTRQAMRAGYVNSEHCVDSGDPEIGAMGYHWVNEDLVDPIFEIDKPEAMMYKQDANGNFKLIAIEYIVIDVGQPHPQFGDHPFDVGGTPVPVDHYSLHVWLYENNPNGLFTPFNPNVSCP